MKSIKAGNLAGYALILTACLLPISLPAQVGSNGQIGKGKKAYGVPISDKEITFRVVLPDVMTPKGPYTATVRVKEGAMAKIAAFRAGFAYAVIPVAQGIDNDSAYFAIYKLTQDDAGNESVIELEHLILNKGETSESTKTQHKIQIELVDISIPKKGPAQAKETRTYTLPSPLQERIAA